MKTIFVYILSFIFAVLIICELNLVFSKPIIEGATNQTYEEYSGKDPLILAKQNAGNIQFLNDQAKNILNVQVNVLKKITTLEQTVDSNTESIHQILQAQKDQTDKLKGVNTG